MGSGQQTQSILLQQVLVNAWLFSSVIKNITKKFLLNSTDRA